MKDKNKNLKSKLLGSIALGAIVLTGCTSNTYEDNDTCYEYVSQDDKTKKEYICDDNSNKGNGNIFYPYYFMDGQTYSQNKESKTSYGKLSKTQNFKDNGTIRQSSANKSGSPSKSASEAKTTASKAKTTASKSKSGSSSKSKSGSGSTSKSSSSGSRSASS